jgi:brefeldin A-inhibited guanine nucleotide-exchange protein
MDLEEGLRLLLSQFILPGESQQIERIMSTFSEKYMNDNPNAFANGDIPFILAYSILMLNTDAHSSKIQNKNKMKKHEFIVNNMKVCPGVSSEYFEKIYDRIVAHEISTRIDCNYYFF